MDNITYIMFPITTINTFNINTMAKHDKLEYLLTLCEIADTCKMHYHVKHQLNFFPVIIKNFKTLLIIITING